MSRRPVFTTSEGTHRGSFGPFDWTLFGSIAAIWGSSFVLIDIGLDAFAPGLVTSIRVTSGAVALWLFSKARLPVDREDLPRVIALSLLWVAIPFTLFPVAQQWINSAVTGMLNGAMPIFAATVASIMLRRAPRIAQTVGIVVGFVGVVAIGSPSIGRGSAEALGVVLVVVAVLCYGIAVNLAAPLQQRYGSLPVMARMLAFASLWTLPLGVADVVDSTFAWPSLTAVLVLGVIGTGLAFVIMGTLVGRVGSTRASFITYLIPVVALVLGVALRGDRVTPVAGVGVVLVIAGAILASRREA